MLHTEKRTGEQEWHNALLPPLDKTERYEQYMTVDTEDISRVLDSVELKGRTVIEIGVGSGAITMLLLERGAAIHGYEIDPSLIPKEIKERIDLVKGDYANADLSTLCAKNSRPLLVANPPYRQLRAIREFIQQENISEYVLFIPATQRMLFPEARVVAHMSGETFSPHALGHHLIIHGESRNDLRGEKQQPATWGELATQRFPHLSLSDIETQIIKNLTRIVARSIASTSKQGTEKQIILLLSDDPQKVAFIRQTAIADTETLIQAPLYSHPQYIDTLLTLPNVVAALRAESVEDDFRYTLFQSRSGESLKSETLCLPRGAKLPPLHY